MQSNILSKIQTEDPTDSKKPRHLHRRTISKTSEELLSELKISSPQITNKQVLITPQAILDQLTKKGVKVQENSKYENLSDEETNIRNIIDQRKVLSPVYAVDGKIVTNVKCEVSKGNQIKNQDSEKISFNTSTTAITVNDETNIDRILFILEDNCLRGKKNVKNRKNIEELLQKSPEPHYALLLDEETNLRGIFYVENASGYFHRIVGYDNIPMIIPPRKVKTFLCYDQLEKRFLRTIPPRFDAIVIVN